MPQVSTVTQCKSCPWRVDCDPLADIPNGYSVELHERLRGTIADPAMYQQQERMMACHYSKPGEEFACAGWLHNQLGSGNNIAVRLAVLAGRLPAPTIDGEQHPDFDSTLPEQDLDL